MISNCSLLSLNSNPMLLKRTSPTGMDGLWNTVWQILLFLTLSCSFIYKQRSEKKYFWRKKNMQEQIFFMSSIIFHSICAKFAQFLRKQFSSIIYKVVCETSSITIFKLHLIFRARALGLYILFFRNDITCLYSLE